MLFKVDEKQELGAVSQIAFRIREVGLWQAIKLTVTGTSVAGAFDPSDLGQIEITTPSPFANFDMSWLDDLNYIKGGIYRRIAASPGAFSWAFWIPLGAWYTDPGNSLQVLPTDDIRMTIRPVVANMSTLMGGSNKVTYSVELVPHTAPMGYMVRINKVTMTTLANAYKTLDLSEYPDILAVYIQNSSTITDIRFEQDKNTSERVETTRLSLLDQTHWDNRIETYDASFPFLELDLTRNGVLSDVKSAKSTLSIKDTAAEDITIHVISMAANDQRLRLSASEVQRIRSEKIAEKLKTDNTELIEVENTVRTGLV